MKQFLTLRLMLCVAALALFNCTSVAFADQVVNGGFETGTFSPWVVNDPSGMPPGQFSGIGSDSAFAHSGTHYAYLGALGTTGTLSQTLTTTPGQKYSLSFWLANDGTVPPNSFSVFFNGVLISAMTNVAVFPYTNFTFSNLMATGSSTVLSFQYRNDDDFFRLDDVSVNPSGVPDNGSTLWLALPAVALLAALHLRSVRQSLRVAKI
jgi:hypothetical protein